MINQKRTLDAKPAAMIARKRIETRGLAAETLLKMEHYSPLGLPEMVCGRVSP